MLFILTDHSYSFLPYLYNLSHTLTELNLSFLSHKIDFSSKIFNEDNHIFM